MPGSLYLVRGARNGLGRTERYSQIGRILVRRGLLPACEADAGPSSAPRMVAPAWPTPPGWQSKKAASPFVTLRQARSGARHLPRPAARRVRHLLYCWCLWQRHRRSEAAGGHRPAPSGRPALSSASRCPPPEPVGGLGGAEDPGRDGRAAAGQRSRVRAAFRACAYVSRAGGRSCWLRADLSVRGCRRGEVCRAAGTGRPCAGPGPPRRLRASRRR